MASESQHRGLTGVQEKNVNQTPGSNSGKTNVVEISAEELDETLQNEIIQKKRHHTDTTDQKFSVIVEGNIGCGKTTLLNHFSKSNIVEILSEPVDKWRNVCGHNLLGLMYRDPSRWSLTFQTYVQLTMIDLHSKNQVLPVRLMERSLFSAKFCFVENLYRSKKMPEAEYIVLTEWFNWLTSNIPISIDLIVYLRADPEVVHRRILARSRPEEHTIPLEYLQQLHKLHEEWLVKQTLFKAPAPVLILDANNDLESMYQLYEDNRHHILRL